MVPLQLPLQVSGVKLHTVQGTHLSLVLVNVDLLWCPYRTAKPSNSSDNATGQAGLYYLPIYETGSGADKGQDPALGSLRIFAIPSLSLLDRDIWQ